MKPSLVAIAALSTLPLGGCVVAAVGAVGAGAVATVQERSIGTAIDDAGAGAEIKAKLVSRGGYGEVNVKVTDHVALLTGRVLTPEMRVVAEQVAWSSSRVHDVANELNIEPAGGFRANASDAWITTKARTSLTTSRAVRGLNFSIETYNGIVYLMGIARTQAELEEAARRVSYIKGVNEVVSYVKIKGADRGAPDQIIENTQVVNQQVFAPGAPPALETQEISAARTQAELAGSSY